MNNDQLEQLLSGLTGEQPSPAFTERVMAKVREIARLKAAAAAAEASSTKPALHDPFEDRVLMPAPRRWGEVPVEPPMIEAVYRWQPSPKGDAA